MGFTSLSPWLLTAAAVLACTGSADRSRERLASDLRDRLGKSAEPSVGFLNNREHLQVSLSAVAFANSSDSTFAERAKDIATFTLLRYEDPSGLDSITVLDRDKVADGVWRVRHVRTFPVGELRTVR
jgi:hypothetical protein